MAVATLSMDTRLDSRTRRKIGLLDRVELEERHVELYEENILLKKHAKAQEEKMKRLATKLLKLSEVNKQYQREGTSEEAEEKITELSERLISIEKQNANLKGKVSILRQQLDSRLKRHTQYDHIPSRINSGLTNKRSPCRSFSTDDLSSSKRKSVNTQVSSGPVRYGRSLLDEARRENEELEELVLTLKEEISTLRAECDQCKENNKLQALSNEETVLKLQEQLQIHATEAQRFTLEQDVEKIRLQRELQEKSDTLQLAETQLKTLEANLSSARSKCETLSEEVNHLNSQLTEQQELYKETQSKLRANFVQQRSLAELQDMLSDLKFEKELLKQQNEKLTKNLLKSIEGKESSSTDRKATSAEERASELEAKLMKQTRETQKLTEKLTNEREVSERLDKDLSEFKGRYLALEIQHKQLLEKAGRYGNEQMQGDVKPSSVHAAVQTISLASPVHVAVQATTSATPPFVATPLAPPLTTEATPIAPPISEPSIVIPSIIDSTQEVEDLRQINAQVTSELNKTKKLLSLQNKISKDYKREIEMVREEARQQQVEYEKKLDENTKLLEIKANRIKKLESQLKDTAYRIKKKNVAATSSVHHLIPQSHSTPIAPSQTELFQIQSEPTIRELQRERDRSSPPLNLITNDQLLQLSSQNSGKPFPVTRRKDKDLSPPPPLTRNRVSPPPLMTNKDLSPPVTRRNKDLSPPVTRRDKDLLPPPPLTRNRVSPPPPPLPLMTDKDLSPPLSLQSSGDSPVSTDASSLFVPRMSVPVAAAAIPLMSVGERKESGDEGKRGREEEQVLLSQEEVDDDLTEVTDDTMFGDNSDEELPLPSLSPTIPTPSPTKPSVILVSDRSEEMSLGDSLDLSEEEEVKPKDTAVLLQVTPDVLLTEPNNIEVHFSLTIISFTVEEEDTTLSTDPSVAKIFVEYQFLDYDVSELETPISLPKPAPGQSVIFNFTKDFHILPMTSTMALLHDLLQSTEPIIPINVVSDPGGVESEEEAAECEELGTTNLNILEVLQEGEDSVELDEDVCNEDNEPIGFLAIKLNGLNSLRHLSEKLLH